MASLFNLFPGDCREPRRGPRDRLRSAEKSGLCLVSLPRQGQGPESPRMGDRGIMETWHVTTDGLIYIRDFRMSDTSGNVLLDASTGWLLVDTANFRPHAPDALPIPLPVNDTAARFDEPLKKLLPYAHASRVRAECPAERSGREQPTSTTPGISTGYSMLRRRRFSVRFGICFPSCR